MKRLILFTLFLLILFFFSSPSFAQVPQLFNYQGIARDTAGNVLPNRMIGVQLSILDGGAAGTVVYSESFTDTTNAFGLFAAQVGSGMVTSGNFSTINWATGNKYMQTAIDLNGGTNYSLSGTTQLLSVPYALYAQKAVVGVGGAWNLNGNAGTADSNFIGTTDNTPLFLRVDNIPAGRVDAGGNLYLGLQSGSQGPIDSSLDNIGIGYISLNGNTSGSDNAAVGTGSLSYNTTGAQNTAFGTAALTYNITGSYNTAVGAAAGVSTGGLINATAIGAKATATSSNMVQIGNSSVSVIQGQVPFTTPSDGRFKFNIRENVKGLDFILRLRPVTYQFNAKLQDEFIRGVMRTDPSGSETEVLPTAYDEAMGVRRTGFIAQEVEQAARKAGYNFDGINVPRTDRQYYSLSYSSFVVPLVKAIQEQQDTILGQERKLAGQNRDIKELSREVAALAAQLAEIRKQMIDNGTGHQ